MNKILIGITAIAGLISAPAVAADMAVKASPPPPPAIATWTGFYLGVNAGGNWGTSDSSTSVVSPGDFFGPSCFPPTNTCDVNTVDVQNAGSQKTRTSGFVGGFQAGYNWQSGNTMLGIETDFEYLRSAGSSSRTVNLVSGNPGTVTVGSSMSTNGLFTLRPRLGWVINNNWLVYATGGLAVSDLRPSWTFSETAFGNTAAGSLSDTKAGWTIGGGVEAMLPDKWILGAEYLFVDFSNVSGTVPVVLPLGGGPAPQNFLHSADLQTNIVRLRLSKQF
jgi:outer membrane immunogenic protein